MRFRVDFRYKMNGVVEERKGVKIGRMPIMVGSARCHLRGMLYCILGILYCIIGILYCILGTSIKHYR